MALQELSFTHCPQVRSWPVQPSLHDWNPDAAMLHWLSLSQAALQFWLPPQAAARTAQMTRTQRNMGWLIFRSPHRHHEAGPDLVNKCAENLDGP